MGPLAGIRVVEMAGIGPAPFCGMLLADLGADVIRVDRLAASDLGFAIEPRFDLPNRGKRAVAVDLKAPAGIAAVRRLAAQADILIEGFRPGVMERLGLGPALLCEENPRLVFGRMTGWGQEGPFRDMAGHDINYIAVTGVLAAVGPQGGDPVVPLNLIGDFGGGALYLAMGVLAALHEARASGRGQVVDAAMVDGVASLMTMHYGYRQAGIWALERGSNAVDGGAPFYTTYRCADGGHVAVGPVEARFYRQMLDKLGLDIASLPDQYDRDRWPELRARLAEVFATRSRDDWAVLFEGSDACVSPVLDMEEAARSSMAQARGMFCRDGVTEPRPAPRFSRTAGAVRHPPVVPAQDTRGALADWGFGADEIDGLAAAGVIAADQPRRSADSSA